MTRYEDLNDVITPEDYAKWRRVGIRRAYDIFHSKGFPLLKNIGRKLLADKSEVLRFETGNSKPTDNINTLYLENISNQLKELNDTMNSVFNIKK